MTASMDGSCRSFDETVDTYDGMSEPSAKRSSDWPLNVDLVPLQRSSSWIWPCAWRMHKACFAPSSFSSVPANSPASLMP
jgi:hypothetical protein